MRHYLSLGAALEARKSFHKHFKDCFAMLAMAMMFSLSAHAADEERPFTYSPDTCEFSVEFPEKPYEVKRCEDKSNKRCYQLVSYTQTFELDSTVNFRVICNPIGPDVRAKYDREVSLAAVRAMGRRNTLSTLNTNFRNEGPYRLASLVGEGKSGVTPMIYIAQLWVGETSVMSVEAELIGEAHEKADLLFSDVMKSVGPKSEDEAAEKPEGGKAEGEEKTSDSSAPKKPE